MASELTVQTLRGPTSGVNANQILIPSGQKIIAPAGGLVAPGQIVQVVNIPPSTAQTSISSSSTWFGIDGSTGTITTKLANSKILYYFMVPSENDTTNASQYLYQRLVVSYDNWSTSSGIANSMQSGGSGHDTYTAVMPMVMNYIHEPNVSAGTTISYRMQVASANATNTVMNQQGLSGAPSSDHYIFGHIMEIAV